MVQPDSVERIGFPLCELVPAIIDTAKQVEGFGRLKHREDQDAVLSFAEAYISFFNNPENEQLRDEFYRRIHDLQANEVLRSIAFSVALRAQASLRTVQVKQ